MPRRRSAGDDEEKRVDVARHGDQVRVVAPWQFGPGVPGVIDDGHVEGGDSLGDSLADASHPDDTDGAVAEGGAERKLRLQPAALAHPVIRLGKLAYGGEQETDGEVGHLIVQ